MGSQEQFIHSGRQQEPSHSSGDKNFPHFHLGSWLPSIHRDNNVLQYFETHLRAALKRDFKLWSPHWCFPVRIRSADDASSLCSLALIRSQALSPGGISSTSLCCCVFKEKHRSNCCSTLDACSKPAITKFQDAYTGKKLAADVPTLKKEAFTSQNIWLGVASHD